VLGGLSLKARLVLGVVVLALVGLVAADIATYKALGSFLVQRTDNTLDSQHQSYEHGPGPNHGFDGRPGPGGTSTLFVQYRSSDGKTILGTTGAGLSPKLPATISMTGAASDGRDLARHFTVGSTDGSGRYRVRAALEQGMNGGMLVLATSLHDVDGTLHRLLLIELLVTAAVLLALAAGGFWVVRLGLRPLRDMERTAGAIAAGDLSRRVERADDRTEVGRLGLALNTMLSQIESAFKAREASERKLRRFVADASHELRTPLAAVRAYAELFGRGAAQNPADLERSMTGIGRESERMSLLVDDLLLLARLDEGRPLASEPVRLDELVHEAVDAARAVDPERPLECTLEEAVVAGDRDRIRQVVDNLLANVRAHTPSRRPAHVNVTCNGRYAILEVADEGPGLEPEQAEHVFERFYRTDSSRARASGGVGLGLSIVAAVAEAHGGRASVESVPAAGTTFRIELPLMKRGDAG
jgi:two-component system, OmpR family, sensor kinase